MNGAERAASLAAMPAEAQQGPRSEGGRAGCRPNRIRFPRPRRGFTGPSTQTGPFGSMHSLPLGPARFRVTMKIGRKALKEFLESTPEHSRPEIKAGFLAREVAEAL